MYSAVRFQHKRFDRASMMKRIETVAKASKPDIDLNSKIKPAQRKKQVVKETKQILFKLLWGNKIEEQLQQKAK